MDKKEFNIKALLKRIPQALIHGIFPPKCLVCGSLYSLPSQVPLENLHDINYENLMSLMLCPDCLPGFLPVNSPLYRKDFPCAGYFRKVWSSGVYVKNKGFSSAVQRFKYNGKISLAEPFEMLLFQTFIKGWKKGEIDFVVPVPLHVKRLRKRGFNQAYLLIRNWPKLAQGFKLDFTAEIQRDILLRNRKTRPQVGLGMDERRKNIKDAFSLKKNADVKGKKILLVDDVFTTGSTIDECAKIFIENGAEYVDALTLAMDMF